MAIRYRLMPDGAFVAGDEITGRTIYAYPTSESATAARETPKAIAKVRIDEENTLGDWRNELDDFDVRNWERINGARND